MNSSEFKALLKASYSKKIEDIGDWKIDHSLSGQRAKVYVNSKTGHVACVHRGTQGASDWVTDLGLLMGFKNNARFKHAERIQQEAQNKYGKIHYTLGHSLGASIAEKVGKNSKKILTYNKPIIPIDILKTLPDTQHDVRVARDPVSILTGYQSGNAVNTIESNS